MRIFIAVEIPQDVCLRVEAITSFFKTKTSPTDIKWVNSEHLHLTIKFIGDMPEGRIKNIETIMAQSLAGQAPFNLGVGSMGMFPNQNNPRVIWLGITGGEPLVEMHKSLDQNLSGLGIPREGRTFSPHLTIGRVRRNVDSSAVKAIGQTLSQFKVDSLGLIQVDRVHLFQSVLMPTGPIYTNLFSVLLNPSIIY
ncbi:MAG: RNA 2',3'-cyclic phosphodiesterase [Chloroflexi bacterium]|nr:RNA 2',3'-cyclic phosphodiesterase [Chloroflexota bacterium]